MKRAFLYAGAGVVVLAGVYLMAKRKAGEPAAAAVGRLAVGAVADAGVGAVKGIGALFGIPDTDAARCRRDLAAGNTFAASMSCPASDFFSGVYNSQNITYAQRADANLVDRQIDRIMERQGVAPADLGGVYDHASGDMVGYHDAMGNRVY